MRPRGTGQCIDLGNGKYRVKWYVGRNERGGKVYRTKTLVGRTAAEKYLRDRLSEPRRDCAVGRKDTVGRFLLRWLEHQRHHVTPRTWATDKLILETHVIPMVGEQSLWRFNVARCQALLDGISERRGRALSPRTHQVVKATMRKALSRAVAWGLIPANPMREVRIPRQRKRRVRVLTAEELRRLSQAMKGKRFEPLFRLLLETGMSPAEALGMRWGCVDLDGGTIRIERNLTIDDQQRLLLGDVKVDSRMRTLPLSPALIHTLRAHRQSQCEHRMRLGPRYIAAWDLVFPNGTGCPLRIENVRNRHFLPLCKEAEIEGATLYTLRHTCATQLLKAGVPVKVVSERLGHASAKETLDTYAHLLPGMQESATQVMADLIAE